jgi:DNA-binding CsgD family transcriptional regulator
MTDPQLSEREQELLILVATGASNKEISQKLFISINTVKVHLRNIFTKLGVASRTEAAMWAVQNGLVNTGGKKTATGSGFGEELDSRRFITQSIPWIENIPAKNRPWLIIGVAVIFVIIGFGISLVFRPTPETPVIDEAFLVSNFEGTYWNQLAEMPTARAGLAAVAYNNQIFAIAGEGEGGVLNNNERYDPTADIWDILSPKSVPVADVEAGVIGGRIYIPGGRLDNGKVTDILEIYDPKNDTWSHGSPLPMALSAYALATFEGKLFLFGGWDGEVYLDTVFMYDPSLDKWSKGSSMSTPRGFAEGALVNDIIYIIGGINNTEILGNNEIFSPISDISGDDPWIASVPIPVGWEAVGIASIAEKLYIASSNRIDSIIIHEFAIRSSEWREIKNSIRPYSKDFGIVSIGSEIYLLGGLVSGEPVSQNLAYKVIYTISIPIVK